MILYGHCSHDIHSLDGCYRLHIDVIGLLNLKMCKPTVCISHCWSLCRTRDAATILRSRGLGHWAQACPANQGIPSSIPQSFYHVIYPIPPQIRKIYMFLYIHGIYQIESAFMSCFYMFLSFPAQKYEGLWTWHNLAVALDILQRRGRKALVDLTDQGHILVPEPAALLGRPSSQRYMEGQWENPWENPMGQWW